MTLTVAAALLSFSAAAQEAVHDAITPDAALTPGQWHEPATPLATLCAPGYTRTVRHVSASEKDAVFLRYGYDLATVDRGAYEIDHLVSLELDGTNDISNLWPESKQTEPLNAITKDHLENALKRLVCSGAMPLAQAQHMIATDWYGAYQTVVLHQPDDGQ